MSPRPEPDPSSLRCFERTRSTVMTILLIDGLLIAISGLLLRNREPGISLWLAEDAYRRFHLALLILMFVGSFIRLVGMTRLVMNLTRNGFGWFFWSHTGSALIGTLAIPIGFVYGWAVRPMLSTIGPFWAVALVLGILALPRMDELIGIDPSRSSRPDQSQGS